MVHLYYLSYRHSYYVKQLEKDAELMTGYLSVQSYLFLIWKKTCLTSYKIAYAATFNISHKYLKGPKNVCWHAFVLHFQWMFK